MKLDIIIWKMGSEGHSGTGADRAREVCGASAVFGVLITIKFGKKTV